MPEQSLRFGRCVYTNVILKPLGPSARPGARFRDEYDVPCANVPRWVPRVDPIRVLLLTGSIAGFMPGSYQAVYNGTKAFLDSFSFALRAELKGSGVTVTCLMPGATETEFFERADMMDTNVGTSKKDEKKLAAQSEALREQNKQLADQFAIRGYPTVVILNFMGQRIGDAKYMKGGPEFFLKQLDQVVRNDKFSRP